MLTEKRAKLAALRDEIASFEFVACGMPHERVLSMSDPERRSHDGITITQVHTRAKLCTAEIRRRRPICGHTTARNRLRRALEVLASECRGDNALNLHKRLEELDQRIGALDHAMGTAQLELAISKVRLQTTCDSTEPAITALEKTQILLMEQLMDVTEEIVQMIEKALISEPTIIAAAGQEHTVQDRSATALTLRATAPTDDDFLYRLFRTVKSEEMGALLWDEATLNLLMRTQFAAHEQHYRALDEAHDLMVVSGNDMVGRMIVLRDGKTIHVADISLLPDYRGRGIGRVLIGTLQQEAVRTALPLRLRVIPTSRAANLYRRLEFQFIDEAEPYRLMEWQPSSA